MASSTASYRAEARATIGARYSGALHFAFTSTSCLAAIALLLAQVHEPSWREWLAVPVTGYFLCYEWLHLSYHLPDAAIGRIRWLRFLRKHHAWHHSPEETSSSNFNITFPICDALFGTARRPPGDWR